MVGPRGVLLAQELQHKGLPYQDQLQVVVVEEEADDFQSNFPGLFVPQLHHQLLLRVGKQNPQHQVLMVLLQQEEVAPIGGPKEVKGQTMMVITQCLKQGRRIWINCFLLQS